ncbi:transketolase [Treponema sp. OMZ 840]|uniref:transketolase n=1 Tax=Treponema sp. OMZ 840 TaxID=244313 RepID=UPI003D8A8364
MNTLNLAEKAHYIRCKSLETAYYTGAAHIGGSLSTVEILTVLYYKIMNVNPVNFKEKAHDRFILSKGHGALALYAILADKGFYAENELHSVKRFRALLQGHPIKTIPGIEMSSGSLGQGISFGIGKAIALERQHNTSRVFVLAGDGEMQEGQNWEALLLGAKCGLKNLTVIVDANKLQLDNTIERVLSSNTALKEKFAAFGWDALEVDGHNIDELEKAFECKPSDKPKAVIANTVKGKGVSFMENALEWHSAKISTEQLLKAGAELNYSFKIPEGNL